MNKHFHISVFCILIVLIFISVSSCTTSSLPSGEAGRDTVSDTETEAETQTASSQDEYGTISFEGIEYRYNLEQLNHSFKGLNNTVTGGCFKYFAWNEDIRIGPSNYQVSGFLTVTPEETELIESMFDMESVDDVRFPRGIDPEDTGYSDFEWVSCPEFRKWIENGRWIGDAYYDLNNKIIFFSLGSF